LDEHVESKSDRIVIDSKSGMGRACTRPFERVLASKGLLGEAESRFQRLKDVSLGGVLFALPALLENGLLRHIKKYFNLNKGFYGIRHLFLTIAFMALLRLKSPENLRNVAPGELGKLIGLDRIPEVKTLRQKLEYLSSQNQASEWGSELSKDWMEAFPEAAGTLYVDGHIKPYYGKQTKLPRRYLSRQRLCLSGMSDFWVNDLLGLPFFVVRKAENKGLLAVLKDDIVPRLLQDVPNQPGKEEFKTNRHLSRFMLVFDREGYSPSFFQKMWGKRIACCTYRKYVKDKWDFEEFNKVNVTLSNGEIEEMILAERGTFLSGKIWVREIRKLTKSGHQTSIITTDFLSETGPLAMRMFSRWCQENFFKYMMEHYGIDRLIEYETEELDDTIRVVNPEYRKLESQIKSVAGKLCRRRAKFYEMKIDSSMPEKKRLKIDKERAELLEEIELFENDLTELKNKRKATKQHVTIGDLPESEKFKSLAKEKKLIVDTVKMIAYRAETAMVGIIRQYMSRKDDARALIRQVFKTEVDIKPDYKNKILEISLHNLTNESSDRIIQKLCEEINNTETIFPDTDLRLVAKLVST